MKTPNGWNIILNEKNCPSDETVVVALWISTTEPTAELAYYDKDTDEWFSADARNNGTPLLTPDYWIEFPD